MGNIVIAIDPSGNSTGKSGFGETGLAYFVEGILADFKSISADDFKSKEEYWFNIFLAVSSASTLVCESFRLFAHKSKQQSGSSMETSQLIGYLRMMCWERGIKFVLQDPSTKARHTDEVLVANGFLTLKGNKHYREGRPTNLHMRDAMRHGLFYLKYGEKGK